MLKTKLKHHSVKATEKPVTKIHGSEDKSKTADKDKSRTVPEDLNKSIRDKDSSTKKTESPKTNQIKEKLQKFKYSKVKESRNP